MTRMESDQKDIQIAEKDIQIDQITQDNTSKTVTIFYKACEDCKLTL